MIFTAPSEVEAFWAPRFNDLRSQGFDHTVRAEAGIKELNSDTAIATSKAVRYAKDGSEMERRGATFTLRKTGGDWKIAALIHHSADNVLKLH